MKRRKLWLSWLLSLCMLGACAMTVACNNGGNSNEDSIGGSVSGSLSGDTTPSDTESGSAEGDVIPDVSIETTADSTGGSSGGDVDDPTPDPTPDVKPKEKTYSVTVLAENGRPMNETTVCFTDNSGAVEKFSTDADGEVLAVLEEKEYDVTLEGLSLGYVANQDGYRFASGESSLEIVLGIQLVDKADRVGHVYKVGDVMHDFSIPTFDGETLTLSNLLEEKDMVFLNFWYLTCNPCLTEMPWMNNAYNDNRYAGKFEMIAIHADFFGVDEVKEELSARDWNFKFSHNDLTDIANYFEIYGFPTTVIIDSYGIVSFLQVGRLENQAECNQLIESHLKGHFHDVQIWSTVDVPTLEEEGLLKGQCADCGETLSVVLPALNDFDYFVQEPSCRDYEPMRKYGVVVDKTGKISHGDGYGEYVWVASEEAPFYHRVEIQGEIRIMDKEAYPMNGRDSYEGIIKEFVDRQATCAQDSQGYFVCDVCQKYILVRTYREHESYTLTRINETEFTLAWECLNDCGEVGSEIVTLRTEENPEGRVIYTRKGHGYCSDPICDYYAVYDEDGFVLADLKENVEKVPHLVSIDGISYIMDKEMYPMNGGYASVITELEGRESTCTQYGDGFFKCDCCDEFFLVRTYREHEVDMSDGWIETEPTCTEDGVLEGRCTLCLERMTMVLPAFGHVIRSAVTTYPTEESFGVMTITCDDCDCVISVNMPELDDGVYVVYEIATDDGTIYAYEWRYAVEIDGHEYEIYAPFEIFVTNIE